MSWPHLRAVIFDLAGTTVDHGCMAPVGVFVGLFRARGVEVTLAEARGPMGMHKRDHIAAVAALPRVRAAWTAAHGRPPSSADIDAMYAAAGPLQVACIPDHSAPIAGAPELAVRLRAVGIKVGNTTGYNAEMLAALLPGAARRGWAPDAAVCVDDVPAGRPAPFLAWEAAKRLGVYPASAIVHVGDTLVDVQAGLNAGMWSVGVAATGNLVGLPADALAALPAEEREARVEAAREALLEAGAHIVIDSVADLDQVLSNLDRAVEAGARP
jgi:phosphonoacetaldehyde hydrolase